MCSTSTINELNCKHSSGRLAVGELGGKGHDKPPVSYTTIVKLNSTTLHANGCHVEMLIPNIFWETG